MYRMTNGRLIKSNKLIESIWILDKNSGICLFEENLSQDQIGSDISADLASAFLSAISTFVDETFSDGIQNIEFQKRKLYFRFTNELLFVFVFSKSIKTTKRDQDRVMNDIMKSFFLKFGDKLENGDFMNCTSDFRIFSKDLNEIIRAKSPIENFLSLINFLKGERLKVN
ncbi:MAG: hypothetical protein ACTSR8_05515 [Promethearchaeota archaeon]